MADRTADRLSMVARDPNASAAEKMIDKAYDEQIHEEAK